ncbi:MAG: hypothetical protein JJU00_03525 [Opitutales bacterium]|nr:hypothetical protein [Opitutales bacterium]
MKIWNAYGSEHSMNLVMIGRFKSAGAAEAAKDAIEELQSYLTENEPDGSIYSDELMEIFRKLKIHTIGPSELDQFRYDFRIDIAQEKVIIKTDESDVSALWKALIDRGARVEMFSAHDYPKGDD